MEALVAILVETLVETLVGYPNQMEYLTEVSYIINCMSIWWSIWLGVYLGVQKNVLFCWTSTPSIFWGVLCPNPILVYRTFFGLTVQRSGYSDLVETINIYSLISGQLKLVWVNFYKNVALTGLPMIFKDLIDKMTNNPLFVHFLKNHKFWAVQSSRVCVIPVLWSTLRF